MNSQRIAGWLWAASLILLPVQFVVAAGWPLPYSWHTNLISDLGATMCGIADEGSRAERYVCSPGHLWANAATVANGLLLTAGAIALWTVFRRKIARTGLLFLMLGGVLVVGVGLTPWNLQPDLHNLFALVQAPLQWAGMILLAFGMPRRAAGRALPAITIAAVILSVAGFVLFILAVGGSPWAAGLGTGFTERLAFDTLTLWGGIVGIVLLTRAPLFPPAAAPGHVTTSGHRHAPASGR